ncbi:MAG: tetratricopeptide repeat protein [Candidatus Hydrogenedentes bacterium]|nr:tetratricopeptide repeat protein [Candidatus Hydrogenedentota bacterium]
MRRVQAVLFLALSGLLPFICQPAAAQSSTDHNAQGVEHYEAQEWKLAIAQFERALKLKPDSRVIRQNLSNAYQAYAGGLADAGQYATAIRQLEATIQFDPANPQPLVQLGAYYLHEGLVADAIFRLEEAIELAPDDADAHFLLGEAYYKDGDARSALQHWEWVSTADPSRTGLAERIETARREERVEADFAGRNSRHFSVNYDREAEGALVREVLQVLEDAYREVGRTFGRAYPPTPIQVSLYTVEGFSESTQLDGHVGAVYDGTKIRCPVIDKHGKRLPADELRRRLVHEYVHVVVHHIAKQNVPWWLNEGLAETLSRELGPREIKLLQRARESGSLHRLSDISGEQLGRQDVAALRLAYTQSHATVGFLKQRFGTRRFATLLEALAQGEDPEVALRRSFRYTYRTLELAVSNYIKDG